MSRRLVSDTKTGYGDKVLDGNGFPCMVEQQVSCGLVCIFEDGMHSPCDTHDNFLHLLFDFFFRRLPRQYLANQYLASIHHQYLTTSTSPVPHEPVPHQYLTAWCRVVRYW